MISFIRHGYELRIHTYEPNRDYPEEASVCDAERLLPKELSTAYTQAGKKESLASFANRFRYKLLLEQGGLWIDTDMLCLRPEQEMAQFAHCYQDKLLVGRQNKLRVNNALIMVQQANHAIVDRLSREVEEAGFVIKKWGDIGPMLLTRIVKECPDLVEVVGESAFYPIEYGLFFNLLLPERREVCERACESAYTVHLWNEFYRSNAIPKNVLPPEGSFLHSKFIELLDEDIAPALPAETVRMLINGNMAFQEKHRTKRSRC